MSRIENIFNKHLDAIEKSFDMSICGEDAAERLHYLHLITRENNTLSQQMKMYASFVNDKNNAELDDVRYDNELSSYVAELLFSKVLAGAVNIYPRTNVPKNHHWLPVVYLKGFSDTHFSRKSKVRAEIKAVSFNNGRMIDAVVKDSSFAHQKDNENGFYDLSVESFFSAMETNLSRLKENLSADHSFNGMSAVYTAAFFLVQSIRNPHPSYGFASGDFRTVIRQVMSNFDAMGNIYVNFGYSKKKLMLSPYVPERMRIVSGVRMLNFPLNSHYSAVFSNEPVKSSDVDTIIAQFRESSIKWAMKKNNTVFGVSSSEL